MSIRSLGCCTLNKQQRCIDCMSLFTTGNFIPIHCHKCGVSRTTWAMMHCHVKEGVCCYNETIAFEASKQKEVSSYVKIEEELLPLYRQLRNGKNIEQTRLLCEMVYVVCKTKYLMMLG